MVLLQLFPKMAIEKRRVSKTHAVWRSSFCFHRFYVLLADIVQRFHHTALRCVHLMRRMMHPAASDREIKTFYLQRYQLIREHTV